MLSVSHLHFLLSLCLCSWNVRCLSSPIFFVGPRTCIRFRLFSSEICGGIHRTIGWDQRNYLFNLPMRFRGILALRCVSQGVFKQTCCAEWWICHSYSKMQPFFSCRGNFHLIFFRFLVFMTSQFCERSVFVPGLIEGRHALCAGHERRCIFFI